MEHQSSRERGTLQKTLPQSPYVTLILAVLLCASVAAYFFEYSLYDGVEKNVTKPFIEAAMGATSVVVGIVYNDPYAYGISFSISLSFILLIHDFSGHQQPNFQVIQYFLPLLASFATFQSTTFGNFICSLTGSKKVLNPFNFFLLYTGLTVPILVAICQIVTADIKHSIAYSPSLLISAAVLSIYHIYYSRRSHKNGGLLSEKQLGKTVIISICILYFVSYSTKDYGIHVLMPFLLGSILATGLTALLAFVADFWYTVGTGQFFMVSLDTVGILFYFLLPVVILSLRFTEKYEGALNAIIQSTALIFMKHLNGITGLGMIDEAQFHVYTALFMTLAAIIGIPLIHNLCPINGHLFGRAYTHGNPNTKKIAICVNFSDYKLACKKLSKEEGNLKRDDLLNIFVTLNDIVESEDLIKMLYDMGHNIGLRLGDDNNAPSTLDETFRLYEKTMGGKPKYYHTGISKIGKHPSSYQVASKLNMLSILWSTYVNVSTNEVSKVESITTVIGNDIAIHRGGSIVYLCNENCPSHASIEVLWGVFDVLKEKGFMSATLSTILVDSNQMDL